MGHAGSMDVLTFTDAAAFAALVDPVIERYPAFASIIATNLDQTLNGPGLPAHWFLIQDDGRSVAAAMHTPPFPLIVTPAPDPGPAMRALAGVVADLEPDLPGLSGPVPMTAAFSEAWQQLTGRPARAPRPERVYEILARPAAPDVAGQARLATEADVSLAAAWSRDFNLEAMPDRAGIDAELSVRRRLARGRLLFWETEAGPVSMAGVSRSISGVARIGGVYTPKHFRRKGFASAVTVAATGQGFDDGAERCVLYTDLTNPTSNAIYQAIGYRPVGDAQVILFD
jgi:predicted GNAT family acetyltransferase